MKKNITVLLILLSFRICNAQDIAPAYFEYIKQAENLFTVRQFKFAAVLYTKAFEANGGVGKVKDRYKAACSWALIHNPDSAFFQLYKIAIKGMYIHFDEISAEPDFKELHNDKRWQPLMEIIKKNQEAMAPVLNGN